MISPWLIVSWRKNKVILFDKNLSIGSKGFTLSIIGYSNQRYFKHMPKLLFLVLLAVSVFAEPSIEAYNQFISAKMIHVSKATYDIKDQDICPTCQSTFTTHRVLKKSDLLALIGYDSTLKAVVVAFRGSDNLKNWVIDDARISRVKYNQCINCKVHKGFLRAYEDLVGAGLRPAVEEVIAKYSPESIIYTGHSLGGAIAGIAALKLEQEGYARGIKLLLYTLGQPRVGNNRFARYHELIVKNNYRVVHNKDIVPHKPSYVFGFRHAGNEVWYKPNMTDIKEMCESESDKCSNGVGDLPHSYSGGDHSSANYILLYDRIISS